MYERPISSIHRSFVNDGSYSTAYKKGGGEQKGQAKLANLIRACNRFLGFINPL